MRNYQRFLLLGLYITAIVLFFALDLHDYFSFKNLQTHRAYLIAFVQSHSYLSPLIYICVYSFVIGLSIPIGAFMTVTGGFLFGALLGTTYTVIGATIGAIGIFLLARSTIGDPMRKKAGPWLKKMSDGFHKHAFNYLLTIRLIPIFPFFAVNLVPAILGISLKSYVAATAIGIIPVTYLYSSVGSGIGEIFVEGKNFELSTVLSPQIILGLSGIAILSFLPVIYKKFK